MRTSRTGIPITKETTTMHDLESDRLSVLLAGGAPSLTAGPISIQAAALGTPEEWAWSAVSYLKAATAGTRGGTNGGKVEASAAAIGLVLGLVEQLADRLGIIGHGALDPVRVVADLIAIRPVNWDDARDPTQRAAWATADAMMQQLGRR